MPVTFFNDVEFKIEDAVASLLAPHSGDLGGAPLHLSLLTSALETSHVAVIVAALERADGHPRTGNWRATCRVKVVTAVDETLPVGFVDLRTLHRQRCGVVRDAVMVP